MSALLRPGRIALVLSLAFACAAPLSEKWKAVPAAASEGALVDTSLVKRIELPNGLRLLILEDHRLPRVVLGLTVRRGAGVESPAQAGLAKFVAAGMDRGAGTRNAIDLARTVDGMGASLMVSAGWDLMQVGMKGLSSDTDSLLQILADVALRPRFEPAELRKARDMQLALLASAVDSPLTRVGWEMARVLYPSHRYGLPLSGTDQSVEAFDAAAARAFHRKVFVPGNAIVSVSGDVRAAEIEARIRTLFGGWEKRKLPDEASPPPRPTPARTTLVVVDRPDLAQASIRVGQGGIARRSPDRIPAILVNAVLGGSGFSSRLMARVRAEEGLVYGVDSWFSMRRRAGPFQVSTATRVEEAGRVVDLLLEGIEGIRKSPPSDTELARVKSFIVGRFALNLETSDALVSSLVTLDVYGLPDDSLETYRSRVEAVRRTQAAKVAGEVLHPGHMAIVVLGPAKTLVPLLEAHGTVKVVPNEMDARPSAEGVRYSP